MAGVEQKVMAARWGGETHISCDRKPMASGASSPFDLWWPSLDIIAWAVFGVNKVFCTIWRCGGGGCGASVPLCR
jgi:hypothetical protein